MQLARLLQRAGRVQAARGVAVVARTRLGLESLLRAELETLAKPGSDFVKPAPGPASATFVAPEGRQAEGAVEVHSAEWAAVYRVLRSRLAQSVWVRVGEPFACDSLEAFEEVLSTAPFESFLADEPRVTVSAWERQSRLDAADLEAALRRTFPTPQRPRAVLRAVLQQSRAQCGLASHIPLPCLIPCLYGSVMMRHFFGAQSGC